ncbi:MAG: hypothetical protein KF819_11480 [Labilithrix sp.]|nr:hypothetical protein [Labilithrix sp.]
MARTSALALLFTLVAPAIPGCAETPPASPASAAVASASTAKAPRYPNDDASWGRFHSKRFLFSFPLPDGKAWRIDDHSRPTLFAVHEATGSKLTIASTQEDELMNRQKCEARARDLGWIDSKTLTTVDDEVTVGPEAYDSRVWIALDAGKPGGSVEGHVYLFGAFIRRCLLVHLSTRVPSASDDDVLSERLVLARTRILRGIVLSPPRTTDDATVPRDKPEIRR